jgi:1,4-dihydroxy-2-naphthoate octaprenyltransferase
MYGAMAAAWALVVTETVLFAGQALLVARRTGVAPLPPLQLAAFCFAALLIVLLTIPNSADWLLLAGIALGIAAGAFFRPRKR